MTALGILLTILALAGLVAIKLFRNQFESKLEKMRINGRRKVEKNQERQEDVDALIAAERFWAPEWVNKALVGFAVLGIVMASFTGMMFYAEPTFQYHVRPIWSGFLGLPGEKVVFGKTGYTIKGYGRVNDWKNAMTVQAKERGARFADEDDDTSSAESATSVSAKLDTQTVVFLDQVDAQVSATVRYQLPADEVNFLRLIHTYRSPENLLATELIPAFRETLKATGSLMSAEEYFSGGRTEFITAFEDQMMNGVYVVRRVQVLTDDVKERHATATGEGGDVQQASFDDEGKVTFKVEKILGPDGQPLRKQQTFKGFGITIISAHVTKLEPNNDFKERMKNKQRASAQRAVNREERIQEEEQKFLAIAKGQREIAEVQAAAQKEQMTKTTHAETQKRLALIEASQMREKARIAKETAQIDLEKAELEAQRQERLADAEAYEKKKLLEADNALKVKLSAIVQMNRDTMSALSVRPVPSTMIVNGGGSDALSGVDMDIQNIANTQLIKNLKALDLDLNVSGEK